MGLEQIRPTSTGPVGAEPQVQASGSAGPLFPEEQELSTDPRLTHAGELLSDITSTDAFQIHPGLRVEEARPFGAYPGEGPTKPVEVLLDNLKSSIASAQRGMADGELDSSLEGIEGALAALHGIGNQGGKEIVAPLHTWLPDGMGTELMSRLTFSYAELHDEGDNQRRLIHYLDLLLENLPNPLEGQQTSPRERLLRMFSLIYTGRALDRSRTVQEAIRHYSEALEINDLHTPGIEEARLIAYAELINLHFKRAYKLSSERKTERFMNHVGEIVALREAIEGKLSAETQADALIALRQSLAGHFWNLGLVESAYKELHGIQSIYSSRKGFETFGEIVDNSNLPAWIRNRIKSRFTDGERLLGPDEIRPLPPASRAWLWVMNSIKNSHRGKTWDTVKAWAGGGAVAAGAVLAATGGDAQVVDLLMATGGGAAVMDGALRFSNGASSPRTSEAMGLGINDVSTTDGFKRAAGFAAGTLLPYALMGGGIPGIGALESVPVLGGLIEPAAGSAIASGSLYGPGALVSGGIDTLFGEAAFFADAFRNAGAGDAIASYANHLGSSTLGSTLTAAYSTYQNALISMFDGTLGARIASAWNSASGDAANVAFNSYKAASFGYYAASRLSPKFRENMNRFGPIFVPGGLALAADLGDALGAYPGYMDIGPLHDVPMNLIGTAAVGAGYQVLGQTLIGNKGLREIQWYNLIGCGMIINGYVGVSSNFDPAVKSETLGQMMAESVGRQIGMLPIIAAHGTMLMVDPRRFAENKAARLLFYDHFGNITRIALGRWDGFGPVAAGVTIGFFLTNSMLGRTFNDLAGSRPASLSFQAMLRNAEGNADEGVMRAMERSLRRLPAAPQLTKMSPETLTLPFRAFYHSIRGKKLANYMLPEQKTYAMISDLLMADPEDGGLNGAQVDTLISATQKFLDRPDDADVARGLTYILSASKRGPHGERIREFLNQNRDVHAMLRVDRNVEPLPEERGAKEDEIWGALRYPYRVCPEEPIGKMDEAHIAVNEQLAAGQFGTAGMVGAGIVPLAYYIQPMVF